MKHPFQGTDAVARKRLLLPLLVLSLVGLILPELLAPGGVGLAAIVRFELAGTLSAAAMMVRSWSPAQQIQMGFSLGIDYLFLMVYSTAIGLACVNTAERVPLGSVWASVGLWLAWAQWGAAVLDAMENAALLQILQGTSAAFWPPLAFWSAAVKFGLVFGGLLYGAAGLFPWNQTHRENVRRM